MPVFPCSKSVCAFAVVFSEKSPILGTKVAKKSFFHFLSVILGTNYRSCKTEWKAAQNI